MVANNGHKVSLLLARSDVEVNLVDNKGQSALMMAALQGHEAVVSLF
jgi:ankyrin repeat protein